MGSKSGCGSELRVARSWGDGIVAPLGNDITCVVKPGTKIYVFGCETECDNAEPPPFYGATYADQVACARAQISGITAKLTVDGRAIPAVDATSPPEHITLPKNNIDQVPAGPITFAVNGLVALEHPLAPGTHLQVALQSPPAERTPAIEKRKLPRTGVGGQPGW